MKKYFLFSFALFSTCVVCAQLDKAKYPEPEFSNEVYYLKKDSMLTVIRLEKASSKMESKKKMGGYGGYENGYSMEGEKSAVRLSRGNNLSFIISNGNSGKKSSALTDSMMIAHGINPASMPGMMSGMTDPSNSISLYKVETEKGKRKIVLQKTGSALPFGNKKSKSADTYSFSVKKIREGYAELVLDKSLPRGEYAFSMMNMGMGTMDGAITLFAFAVDNP